jgi:uracil-DNA glycosylase family 4
MPLGLSANRFFSMADASYSGALDFVFDVLSSRRRAGMEASAPAETLRSLMQAPQSGASAVGRRSEPTVTAPREREAVSIPVVPAAGGFQVGESEPAPKPAVGARTATSQLPPPVWQSGEGTAAERMAALRAGVLACVQCPNLAAARAQVVFGQGSVEAALMIIGEAPGAEEDQEGRPFAGEAGELLEKMLKVMGLSTTEVYATNVLKCHPFVPGEPGAVRPPHPEELERCLPYLAAQISVVQPKVIVAMGAGAMHALFGGKTPMGSLRSQWHEVQGIPVMPTFHPNYLLRNDDVRERRKVWEDLMQVMERLGLTVTERHRSFFLKGA